MTYSTKIEKNEETLHWLVDQALIFGDGQYLDALYQKKLPLDEVQDLLCDVMVWHIKINKEVRHLILFAKDFNEQYTTDHNNCFSTAEKAFNRIRGGIAGAKKLYKKFCPRVREDYKRIPWNNKEKLKPSIFERSMLANTTYTGSLFGIDQYPLCVNQLYDELLEAIKDLTIGLLICRNIIKDERTIKEDPEKLMAVYNKCLNEAMTNQRSIVNFLKGYDNLPQSSIAEKMKKMKTEDEKINLIRDLFHNCSLDDFNQFALIEALVRGKDNNLDDIESVMWPNNPQRAKAVRFIVEHLDELDPRGNWCSKAQKYGLNTTFLAMLVKWSELENSRHEAPFIDRYLPKYYHGQYHLVKANSVNTAKNKRSKGNPEYPDFVKRVETLLVKYGVELPSNENRAVNF